MMKNLFIKCLKTCLIISILSSCSNYERKVVKQLGMTTVLDTLLHLYVQDNGNLNPNEHRIKVFIDSSEEGKIILTINNGYLDSDNFKCDSSYDYVSYLDKFMVCIWGQNNIFIRDDFNKKSNLFLKDCDDYIPNPLDSETWIFEFKDNMIVEFNYRFVYHESKIDSVLRNLPFASDSLRLAN